MEGLTSAVGSEPKTRARKAGAPGVLVVATHEKQAKWLGAVLAARDAGESLAGWMRARGYTATNTKAAQRLQGRMRKRGELLEQADTGRLLRSLRAEIVDRVQRRVGAQTRKLAWDLAALKEIDAALRQAAVWERQDKAGGGGTAPAAPGAAVRGARGGGKAAVEASVGALSVGETGGSAGECAVEAAGGALGDGLGAGQGGESGVAGIGPLAGC